MIKQERIKIINEQYGRGLRIIESNNQNHTQIKRVIKALNRAYISRLCANDEIAIKQLGLLKKIAYMEYLKHSIKREKFQLNYMVKYSCD